MYIVMGKLTKVDSLDRYGSEYSHWSGQRGERGRGDFDDVSRIRENHAAHMFTTLLVKYKFAPFLRKRSHDKYCINCLCCYGSHNADMDTYYIIIAFRTLLII